VPGKQPTGKSESYGPVLRDEDVLFSPEGGDFAAPDLAKRFVDLTLKVHPLKRSVRFAKGTAAAQPLH
jgi:hypothetical protein